MGFGATPQPFRGRPLQRESQQGAGSEASLPVTSRVLRRAPKLLYRPTVQCRAKWARPHSLSAPISASKTQPEDSQHPPTCLPPLLHICHIPNSPRKHQQLPGRKSCEKNASVTVSRVLSRDDHLSRPDVAAQVQAMPRTRRAAACVLIRILHQMGFTARTSRQAVGELLPPFHPYRTEMRRYISVALSLESPPPAVSRHPALWCSDFPHTIAGTRSPDHLAQVYHSAKGAICQGAPVDAECALCYNGRINMGGG